MTWWPDLEWPGSEIYTTYAKRYANRWQNTAAQRVTKAHPMPFFKCVCIYYFLVWFRTPKAPASDQRSPSSEFIMSGSNPNPSRALAFCHSDPAIRSTSDFAASDPTILDSAEPAVSSAADDPLAPPEGQWTERQGGFPFLLRTRITSGELL